MHDIKLWDQQTRRDTLARQQHIHAFPVRGKVHKVVGPMLEATGLKASIGSACDIHNSRGGNVEAEVVGFRAEHTLLMPVGSTHGIAPGDPVSIRAEMPHMMAGDHLRGRVLDATGQPMDGKPLPVAGECRHLFGDKLNPYERHLIDTPMDLGVRALDTCLPMGWGQRIGLFAGAGVGKSSLLGMLVRNSDADINVIALVGERSREVREFLDISLGPEAMQRCIVIVATSDMPPVVRVRAALLATTIAEYFRDEGQRVLLMMDSLTRLAQAQREIGLMLGEPPASKGYTPSCFSILAELLERSGPGVGPGDISAIYTVLVEGDDLRGDPIADAAMSVLDGHVVLDRTLAEKGHYPAVNLLASVSRLAPQLMSREQMEASRKLRRKLALYQRMEDMVNLGAYEAGSNPELDAVLDILPQINDFLQQDAENRCPREESAQRLLTLMEKR